MAPPQGGEREGFSTSFNTDSKKTKSRTSQQQQQQQQQAKQKEQQAKNKRNQPIYTTEQVSQHNQKDDMWVIFSGSVFNITEFVESHPGGEDFLIEYAGKDITQVFQTNDVHQHSASAYLSLKEYKIGVVDSGTEEEDDLFDTDENYNLIDLEKPIVYQLWSMNLPRKTYLKMTHTPHFAKGGKSVRFFESDFLEIFTRTPWYVIPLWLIVSAYMMNKALTGINGGVASLCFAGGILIWSLLEYSIHRFIFHMDQNLPDNRFFIFGHFMLHGVHHILPMDK